MIGYLKGKIVREDAENILLQTSGGVGYTINIVTNTHQLSAEANSENEQSFYIHTSVSENDISLWGFVRYEELKLFKQLLNVSGVGARTAQSLIKTIGVADIINAISRGDAKGLRAPGVGQKTAERIIIDLEGKVETAFEQVRDSAEQPVESIYAEEAIAAAVALGYSEREVQQVVRDLLKQKTYNNSQELVKDILKHIR